MKYWWAWVLGALLLLYLYSKYAAAQAANTAALAAANVAQSPSAQLQSWLAVPGAVSSALGSISNLFSSTGGSADGVTANFGSDLSDSDASDYEDSLV